MVEITADLTEGTRVSLSNGRHTWPSDEPFDKGGEDTGPTPYETLLGSLAACTLITLVLYTRHKGIELEGVSARYTHEKVPAPLEQIVGRCPVHKTIENGAHIVDEVEFVA